MDTNIDHYSHVEIANLLKLDFQTISIDSLYNSILDKLRLLQTTEMDIDEKQDMFSFFKDCFIKLCQINDLRCTKNMILSIEEFIPLSFRDTQILHPILYPGSLPETTPQELSVNTYSTKYNRGIVNPLKRENIINTLIINSKFRNKNSDGDYFDPSTDFSIELPESFNNVISLKVASIEFNKCFLNISKYYNNNTFVIETYERDNASGARTNVNQTTVIIPYGSYTITSLTTILNDFFNADPNLNIIEIVYNTLNHSCQFRLKTTPPTPPGPGREWEFNLYFDSSVKPQFLNIGWLLGFTFNTYIFTDDYISTSTTSHGIGFNSDKCVDLIASKFFLLAVDDFNKNSPKVVCYNSENNSFSDNNIIAKIQNNPSEKIIFKDSSDLIFKTRRYFGPVKLQKFKISILDEYGKVIDNNNGDLIVTFEIESLDSPYKDMVS